MFLLTNKSKMRVFSFSSLQRNKTKLASLAKTSLHQGCSLSQIVKEFQLPVPIPGKVQ